MKSTVGTNCNPKQFVANDHSIHILRSFDAIGCLGGSGRGGVSISVGFRTKTRVKGVLRGACDLIF